MGHKARPVKEILLFGQKNWSTPVLFPFMVTQENKHSKITLLSRNHRSVLRWFPLSHLFLCLFGVTASNLPFPSCCYLLSVFTIYTERTLSKHNYCNPKSKIAFESKFQEEEKSKFLAKIKTKNTPKNCSHHSDVSTIFLRTLVLKTAVKLFLQTYCPLTTLRLFYQKPVRLD